jgi:hypothetical protein
VGARRCRLAEYGTRRHCSRHVATARREAASGADETPSASRDSSSRERAPEPDSVPGAGTPPEGAPVGNVDLAVPSNRLLLGSAGEARPSKTEEPRPMAPHPRLCNRLLLGAFAGAGFTPAQAHRAKTRLQSRRGKVARTFRETLIGAGGFIPPEPGRAKSRVHGVAGNARRFRRKKSRASWARLSCRPRS